MSQPAPHQDESAAPSFMSLLDVHDRLDELFLRHQEAVLLFDVELSRATLDDYERELVEHMRFEEDALFPIYERALPIAGGGIDLFRNEHQKLLRYVAGIRKSFETLRPRETGGPTRIIELLDFEAKFKNLLKHHDLRERNILYPVLDRVASPAETRALLSRPPAEA
ncbi:MAG: hemerythrin domain-containing protein [Blastocatellia bacterium]|jgi:hemerythrin-like domain-containing protein|nr:hemerythrin domain-containing protein [Blastocatellia bacterium]